MEACSSDLSWYIAGILPTWFHVCCHLQWYWCHNLLRLHCLRHQQLDQTIHLRWTHLGIRYSVFGHLEPVPHHSAHVETRGQLDLWWCSCEVNMLIHRTSVDALWIQRLLSMPNKKEILQAVFPESVTDIDGFVIFVSFSLFWSCLGWLLVISVPLCECCVSRDWCLLIFRSILNVHTMSPCMNTCVFLIILKWLP